VGASKNYSLGEITIIGVLILILGYILLG